MPNRELREIPPVMVLSWKKTSVFVSGPGRIGSSDGEVGVARADAMDCCHSVATADEDAR
jgi:hypothetical protein